MRCHQFDDISYLQISFSRRSDQLLFSANTAKTANTANTATINTANMANRLKRLKSANNG